MRARQCGEARCSSRKMPCQVPSCSRPSVTGMLSWVWVSGMRPVVLKGWSNWCPAENLTANPLRLGNSSRVVMGERCVEPLGDRPHWPARRRVSAVG